MKTLLLITILLTSLFLTAQDSITSNSCKSNFVYTLNTEIMTFAAATTFDFRDLSEGDVLTWLWDFGDGTTSIEQNPTHSYNFPILPEGASVPPYPYRTVTLTITTADNCESTYSYTIDIYGTTDQGGKSCKSDFYFYQTAFDSIAQTASYKFINMAGGESVNYFWNFSDGLTSTEAEPEVIFDFSRSIRKVCLIVNGADSCTDELCQDVNINSSDGGSSDPGDSTSGCFAAFGYTINYTQETFAPALVLDFHVKSDDEIATYLWDFGDGNTSNEPNPTFGFTYPVNIDSVLGDPNPYRTICLTITTVSGCESSWCQTIDIYTGRDPFDQECNALFSYYQPDDIVTIPEVIPYKFYSTNENIISWTWNFEDGTVSYNPEPLVTFDIFKPTQQVCLTILTSDSCTSKWCETIYVSPWIVDTFITEPVCNYTFRYSSNYPEWASACIGTASAQVVLNDSVIPAVNYYWTNENFEQISENQNVNNLCPTQTYTVTALTNDGCKFSGSFLFNSDGTVTEIPVYWWIYYSNEDYPYVDYNLGNNNYTVEWLLCDGTVVNRDSILLSEIDCGTNEANFFLKDASGNVVYSENVTENSDLVSRKELGTLPKFNMYPVPVTNELNLKYNFKSTKFICFEVSDLTGRTLLKQKLYDVKTGQHFTIDVSSLQKGIYQGKIISDNRIIAVEKFSK
jgi:hypothetical protein